MLCAVAMLAQRIDVATIADLKSANSMIKHLQDSPEHVLHFSSEVKIPYLLLPELSEYDVGSPELLHEPENVPYMFA
eukprot:3017955-Amphidinium_carterae.1